MSSKNQNGRGSSKPTRRSTEVNGYLPPQAIEMEEAIIGVVIQSGNNAFEIAAEIFQGANPFYKPVHFDVWGLLEGMDSAGTGIDAISVVDAADRAGNLEMIGGAYGVMKLIDKLVSSANFESYCRIVQEMFIS